MLDQIVKAESIEVRYRTPDRPFAETAARRLSTAKQALNAYFNPSQALPLVRAFLAPDRMAFDCLVDDVLGIAIERPSDPRRIAQPQRTDIILLSPSAYETQSAYAYVPEDYFRMITHELVHVFQEWLSPGIEQSPLWWDEGLAVYLSNQWQFESQFQFREPVVAAMKRNEIPSWADVQTDPSFAYTFGWTLVRYIEHQWGKDALVRIITQMNDGDVLSQLGEDDATFEQGWRVWLKGGGIKRPPNVL